MRRSLSMALICIVFSSMGAAAQTRRRSTPKSTARPAASYAKKGKAAQTRRRVTPKRTTRPTASYDQKAQAEIRAGRDRIATQIKALTQFLYVFAGVSKGIENAELANRTSELSSSSLSDEQIERNKSKVKDSIRNVRAGLDELESSFRLNPALQNYYPSVAGVAKLGQTAESQAGSGNLDQAGRTLIQAVSKLTDALVAVR